MNSQDYSKQALIALLLRSPNEWYKRGMLQLAVSISLIEQGEWRPLIAKYCPKYAQTKTFRGI